jgi:oligoendopeptidase F
MNDRLTAADWDLTPYFSSLGGEDYEHFKGELERDLERLRAELDALEPPASDNRRRWVELLTELERSTARLRHLASFLGCIAAADSRDERAKRDTAWLSVLRAAVAKLMVQLRARLAAASEENFAALCSTAELDPLQFPLSRLREEARHVMTPELEELAADLGVTGIGAWGRLYDQISGGLTFALEVPGHSPRTLPASAARSLYGDPDPEVRRAALTGVNRAWESVADAVAACLNAIAGTRHVLYPRRQVGHFLDPALFDAAIERSTLDTMLRAVRERQNVPRRFLALKARWLGKERLGFQDLEAPLPIGDETRLGWNEGVQRVLTAFTAYPALHALACEAIEDRWVDHSQREGKRPGGFCSSSPLINQSRIFMTFAGALGDVQTLAHELGHAFHNRIMRDLRPWQRHYPMTLAETASTFAEQLVTDAVLSDPKAPPSQKLAVLDTRLSDAAAFLLNIPMRFDFESAFYEERRQGEVSVSRLQELMLDAQRSNYGDSLDPTQLDPWFWASKLHFYIVGTSFYNFPYTFGYLFSLGLFARGKAAGPEFYTRYEHLLEMTGNDTAEGVARRALGIDLGDAKFWHSCIDLVEADLDAFASLSAEHLEQS